MCGIAGIIAVNDSAPPVMGERLKRMSDTLIHRGPDDEGIAITPDGRAGFAARRLSVIDVAGGHQPLSNEDKTVWACQNGEIYNFHPIRAALESLGHILHTRCDTEVLVHLYEQYGPDCVEHLNGMFAFAVWDGRNRRGVIARDRLGVKPLYYALRGSELIFGSEIQTVVEGLTFARPSASLSIDMEALDEYFSLGYISSPRTIFKEIRKLSPGHRLRIESGRTIVESYWHLPDQLHSLHISSFDELREEALHLLSDSVKLRLIADVPLGVFLSGGMDSAAITALMSEAGHHPLRSFTVGFKEESYDESPLAALTAERYRTDHHVELLTPKVAEELPQIARSAGEPFADAALLPTYWISRFARRRVTVCLSGEGGDEVFAGYETYTASKLARWYRRLAPGPLGSFILPALVNLMPVSHQKMSADYKLRKFMAGALQSPEVAHYAYKEICGRFAVVKKDQIYGGGLKQYLEAETGLKRLRQDFADFTSGDVLNRLLYLDTASYLPDDLLTKVDRASMAHSLEVRTPFLDYRLVEFAFSIPGRVKMPGLQRKHLLKEAVKDLIPGPVLQGKKQGFSVPLSRWLSNELKSLRNDLLSQSSIEETGLLNPEGIDKLLKAHDEGRRNHARPLWSLMMFLLWYRQNKGIISHS